jgi:hypothetical protein
MLPRRGVRPITAAVSRRVRDVLLEAYLPPKHGPILLTYLKGPRPRRGMPAIITYHQRFSYTRGGVKVVSGRWSVKSAERPGSAGIPACNECFSANRSSGDSIQGYIFNSRRPLAKGLFAPLGAHCGREAPRRRCSAGDPATPAIPGSASRYNSQEALRAFLLAIVC